ncbi:hypothetical protein K461DRAFT_134035 [Myriangium duriaei CBS 260.36]|uniref:PHD-type domain-containing protein n=1 Tax=Myriangium duriaei CBS 260.36 TaxID=1168546 RepID=A0A9P4J242_9PEZI|nr:hypothetical protein K461DRAFT_134035 [Myriangium duriaei CBS 260.36]
MEQPYSRPQPFHRPMILKASDVPANMYADSRRLSSQSINRTTSTPATSRGLTSSDDGRSVASGARVSDHSSSTSVPKKRRCRLCKVPAAGEKPLTRCSECRHFYHPMCSRAIGNDTASQNGRWTCQGCEKRLRDATSPRNRVNPGSSTNLYNSTSETQARQSTSSFPGSRSRSNGIPIVNQAVPAAKSSSHHSSPTHTTGSGTSVEHPVMTAARDQLPSTSKQTDSIEIEKMPESFNPPNSNSNPKLSVLYGTFEGKQYVGQPFPPLNPAKIENDGSEIGQQFASTVNQHETPLRPRTYAGSKVGADASSTPVQPPLVTNGQSGPHRDFEDSLAPTEHPSPISDDLISLVDGKDWAKAKRPAFTYLQLSEMAIQQGPPEGLPVKEILEWICRNFSGYSLTDTDLKSGVSNALSVNTRKDNSNIDRTAARPGEHTLYKVRSGREDIVHRWDGERQLMIPFDPQQVSSKTKKRIKRPGSNSSLRQSKESPVQKRPKTGTTLHGTESINRLPTGENITDDKPFTTSLPTAEPLIVASSVTSVTNGTRDVSDGLEFMSMQKSIRPPPEKTPKRKYTRRILSFSATKTIMDEEPSQAPSPRDNPFVGSGAHVEAEHTPQPPALLGRVNDLRAQVNHLEPALLEQVSDLRAQVDSLEEAARRRTLGMDICSIRTITAEEPATFGRTADRSHEPASVNSAILGSAQADVAGKETSAPAVVMTKVPTGIAPTQRNDGFNASVLEALKKRQKQEFLSWADVSNGGPHKRDVPISEIEKRPKRKQLVNFFHSRLGHNTAVERVLFMREGINTVINAARKDFTDRGNSGDDYDMGDLDFPASQQKQFSSLEELVEMPASVDLMIQEGQLVVVDGSRNARGRSGRARNVYRIGHAAKTR